MAIKTSKEQYKNATIDCSDMTITEYTKDDSRTYSIKEILERWDGIENITLTIQQSNDMPQS